MLAISSGLADQMQCFDYMIRVIIDSIPLGQQRISSGIKI